MSRPSIGVVATSRAIADHFEDNYFAHGHTYEAHPLTLAPALAGLRPWTRVSEMRIKFHCQE